MLDNGIELTFTELEGGERDTIDFALFDLKQGERIELNCGAPSTGIVTIQDSGANSTSITCTGVDSETVRRNAILSYRYNLFLDNNIGLYSLFSRIPMAELNE